MGRRINSERQASVTPAFRLAHLLGRLRDRLRKPGYAESSSTPEDCIELLAPAYRRLGLDSKSQGTSEQCRVWAQAVLRQGNRSIGEWRLEDPEERALVRVLVHVLESRMEGIQTMEELALTPQEQVARLVEWRTRALDMTMLTREEQRRSTDWRRFGLELVGALERR